MYPGNDDEQLQSTTDLIEKLGDGALSEPLLHQESNIVEVIEEKQLSKWDIRKDKLRRYLDAHFAKAVIGVIWMAINVILFIQHFILYWNAPNFYVSTARGFGQVLNFNCALILIPVLRNAITFLRQTFLHRFIPFDSNIMFHRRIAWTIVVASYGHGMAHYMNYNLQQSPFTFAYATLAGLTGNLLVFVMVIMYSSAIDAIRRRYFNVFYFAHHLFIVFFILLLLHGPRFWIWFIAPGVIYVIERLMREYRAKKTTTVLEVTNHPSDVIEIKMSKKGFKYKSGQYLYLNAPHISYYEWHPFTITSAPHQEYTSVHIRAVGRWTKKLRNLLAPEEEGSSVELNQFKASDGRAILRLDGPFGAASEEVFDYKTVVLIGAGIGVTPFASILKSLYHKKKANEKCRIEKAYFFWICREYKAFEWFQTLLRELELEMKARNDDLISINPFLTAKLSKEELDTLKQNSGGLDPYTGLESSTKLGRPDFGAIFDELKVAHPGEKIGVFFCGPRVLSKTLRQDCMQKSAKSKKDGAKFIFHKENF